MWEGAVRCDRKFKSNKQRRSMMRKGIIVLAVAVVVSLCFMASYLYCQDNAPKISNLVYDGEKDGVVTLKIGGDRDLIITFECNQRPDTVYLKFYGMIGPRTTSNVYSSPKEVTVEITEKDGTFQVRAVRTIRTPRVPVPFEGTVWVEVGKQKSNVVTKKIDFVM